ncbi:MAG: hypothetical protein ACRESR_01975 [Gammaproteobacteria bacterium]
MGLAELKNRITAQSAKRLDMEGIFTALLAWFAGTRAVSEALTEVRQQPEGTRTRP